jgi:hypothetical protein
VESVRREASSRRAATHRVGFHWLAATRLVPNALISQNDPRGFSG